MPDLIHCTAKAAEFSGELRCNLVQRHELHVYALSCAGNERTIQFLTAGFTSGVTLEFKTAPQLATPDQPKVNEFTLFPAPGGFHTFKHPLGLDTWQMLAVNKQAKYLFDPSDESLWQLLRSTDYTTPLLRHWIPALRQEMASHKQLVDCSGFGWHSQIVLTTDDGLDALVSEGIRAGKLTFRERAVALSA